MAAGLPVISTTVGAEGLPLKHGETILLADRPEDFARECIHLLEDAALRSRIGASGRDLVAAKYSWDSAARVFEKFLEPALI
jgi:glycosyltransferase involved in cell wall biosynthesis